MVRKKSTFASIWKTFFYSRMTVVVTLLFQSIAGNIMTASPISDLNPLFLSARCQVTVSSKGIFY